MTLPDSSTSAIATNDSIAAGPPLPAPIFGLLGKAPVMGCPIYVLQPPPKGIDARRLDVWWQLFTPDGKPCGRKLPGGDVGLPTNGAVAGKYTVVRYYNGGQTPFPVIVDSKIFRWMFIDPIHGNDSGKGTQSSPYKNLPKISGDNTIGAFWTLGSRPLLSAPIDIRGSSILRFGTWGKNLPMQPNATLVGPGGGMFATDGNTADVAFANLDFDGGGTSTLGHIWGRDYVWSNCNFRKGLDTAILIDGTGVDGLYLENCTAEVLNEYTLFLLAVRRPIIINPNFAGSNSQITVRTTKSRSINPDGKTWVESGCGIEGGLFFGGVIAQPSPTGHKAALDFRCANQTGATQTRIHGVTIKNGACSINTEGGKTENGVVVLPFPTVQRGLHFTSCITDHAQLEIHNGALDALHQNWTFNPNDTECVTIAKANADANPPTGQVFESSTGTSTHAFVKIYGAVDVGHDIKVSDSTLHTGGANVPFLKSDQPIAQPAAIGSGNQVVK